MFIFATLCVLFYCVCIAVLQTVVVLFYCVCIAVLQTVVVLFYCVCIAVLQTVVAGLLARSQYPEGPATGHLGKGLSWFPCV
jgi:hypothetical protein